MSKGFIALFNLRLITTWLGKESHSAGEVCSKTGKKWDYEPNIIIQLEEGSQLGVDIVTILTKSGYALGNQSGVSSLPC